MVGPLLLSPIHWNNAEGIGFPSISTVILKLEFSDAVTVDGGGNVNCGGPAW